MTTQLWLELLREECGIDCSLTTPIEQEAERADSDLHDDYPPHGSEVENGISRALSLLQIATATFSSPISTFQLSAFQISTFLQ